MILSRWTRDGEIAEVIERHPLDGSPGSFTAWNVTRGRYAAEGNFASVAEVEDVLFEEGWRKA